VPTSLLPGKALLPDIFVPSYKKTQDAFSPILLFLSRSPQILSWERAFSLLKIKKVLSYKVASINPHTENINLL